MLKNNYKQRKKRRIHVTKKFKTFFVLPVLLVILACTIYYGGVLANAHGNLEEDPVGFKYYKSIEIKSGDTLWGIAQKYMTEEYDSPQEYIEEIKQINGLTSDNLQESKHILVAYYDISFKE
ncbi:LysM peptidoglycan-binding domain-containing protein [Faecalimonas sp.]